MYTRSGSGSGAGPVFLGALVVLGIILLAVGFSAAERVDAGSGCVVLRNGKMAGTADPGLSWKIPGVHRYECYQTRVMNLEIGGTEASKANYRDEAVTAKSSDGVTMSVAAMVYFQLPYDNLGTIYTDYGRSQDETVGKYIQADARDAMRTVIEQKPVDDVYLGGMDTTSTEIESVLREKLEAKGITLQSFSLTSVDPSDEYKTSIQAQVEQQQQADLEAEKVRVEEQRAEQKRVQAQGEADAAVIAAEGQAESNRIIAESLTPEVLQLRFYEALGTINWAIFSPEDVQPMMPIEQPAATPTPAP